MMSRKLAVLLTLLTTPFTLAAPIQRREVPQEHSHERFLRSVNVSLQNDNPDNILDAVFGLLGNAAASAGLGSIADPTCLQQATADRAFTNAKAAGNVQGMVDALIYRALEKNTGRVGLVSDPCTSITAVNPEIAAIQQHQDPASPNAAAVNKLITLELARQIKAIGGNPQDALLSGTFAPGDLNDPTGRGNSCDTLEDPEGCIFTQNLIVFDATAAEVDAAVGDAAGGVASPAAGTACAPNQTVLVTVAVPPAAAATPTATTAASGGNLQRFNGSLGGIAAPTVTPGGRGFVVQNNADFLNLEAALGRSCDVQHNLCANLANSAAGRSAGLTVSQCDAQNNSCRAAIV